MKTLLHDFRLAGRLLVKYPLFTTIVILTMAVAIGLNTAVFSAVEALLLRPLPGTAAPERIVQVFRTAPGIPFGSSSVPHYLDVRERTGDVLSGVASWSFAPFNISSGERPQQLMGMVVSANYFATLGARPAHGRFFVDEEDAGRGAHPVVVLSATGARTLFGDARDAVGEEIFLNGRTMQVVGVAAPEFRGVLPVIDPVGWVPLMQMEAIMPERAGALDRRGNNFMNVVARLRDDASREQAAARLTAVNAELAALHPDDYAKSGMRLVLQSEAGIHPSFRSAQVGLSAVIMTVVGLLLLVACVNVSNLFLARANDRAREMAIRLALGASRAQLVRQLLVESLVFSLLAGAAGLLVASLAIGFANRISLPMAISFRPDLRLNPTVLGFTFGVTVIAGVLFGLAPALQATRPSLGPALKGEAAGGGGRSRVQRGLIVAQMALSIILLTCAGLFVSNLRAATTLDVGFTLAGAATATVSPSLQGYDRARTERFYASLFERLRAEPGVRAVGMIDALPLGIGSSDRLVEIPGYVAAEGEGMHIHYGRISPDYFAAMDTPIRRGRAFTAQDDSAAVPVVVVNERFVERFWPGTEPLGRTVRTAGRDFTVVGVVPTGKYMSLGEEPRAFMFFPQAQSWTSGMQMVVRGDRDPQELVRLLREGVAALDPLLPVVSPQPLAAQLGTALLPARLAGGALGLFGALGLLLAGVGIYGVMAHSVGQRTREIGIRIALGATSQRVVRLVMGQGLRQVLLGSVIGIAGAAASFTLIRGVLYGAGPTTVATFVVAPLVLLSVATLALFVPARRAARLDPQVALRHD
jgi:predicted permease